MGAGKMKHKITWYMGRRILYAQVMSETIALSDIADLNDQLLPFIDQSDSSAVHIVIDVSAVQQVQPSLLALGKAFAYARDRRIGHSVLISSDGLGRLVKALLNKTVLGGVRLEHFTSLEEGIFYLQDVDSSLLMPSDAQVYSQLA